MVDYVEAIKKPFSDMMTLGLGIVIGFVPIVSLLVSGYSVGVARNTIKGDNKLPAWDLAKVVDYIKDLVFALIIGVIYMIPGGILILIGAAAAIGSIFGAIASGDMASLPGGLVAGLASGGIFLILGGILLVVGWILSSMGIMFYAKEGNLGSAFKISAILKKVLTVTYLVTLIVMVIYVFVLSLIAAILLIIPVIGGFIGSGLVTFLAGVTGYTMLAQVFKETP